MIARRIAASFVLFLGLLFDLYGQAFQNLNFEANPIIVVSNSDVYPFPLYTIPDWTVNIDGTPQIGVPLGLPWLDETGAGLIVGSVAIAGNQSVGLIASSYEAPVEGSATESISQTGLVPATAILVEFKLGSVGKLGFPGVDVNLPQNNFYVMMNNQSVPIQILTNTGSFFVMGSDVSQWAGQTAQLTIGVEVPHSYIPAEEILYMGVVDDVVFVSGLPNLSISNSANSIVVSWPNTGNYILQQNNDIGASAGWTTSAYPITTNADNTSSVTVVAKSTGNMFLRLISP